MVFCIVLRKLIDVQNGYCLNSSTKRNQRRRHNLFFMVLFYDMIYKTMNAICEKNTLAACRQKYSLRKLYACQRSEKTLVFELAFIVLLRKEEIYVRQKICFYVGKCHLHCR